MKTNRFTDIFYFSAIENKKGVWEFAYDPIKNMIGDPPTNGKNWLMIAKDHFKKALPRKFAGELIFKFEPIIKRVIVNNLQ
jgi:hypothetical protein